MRRVVVAAPPFVRATTDLASLPACADAIELRLDLLPGALEDVARWVAASPRPVLATVRSEREGGAFRGTPADAARLLEAAARAGARWIDVEADVAPLVRDLPAGVGVVASHHGEGEPRLAGAVAGRAPEHAKVARSIADAASLARLVAEARAAGPTTTLVPYGPLGALRAAFVDARGGRLLFGAPAQTAPVVPGQPSLLALLDELRAGEVTPAAALHGLLGTPPSVSPSPSIHNAVFRARGRDALFVPLPGLSVEAALRLPFAGFAVTTPHKEEAARRATGRAPEVEATGAANTLLRTTSGGWLARNTDVDALFEVVSPARAGERAFVLGAGGFARAAVHVLVRRGYDVRLGARDAGRGRSVARALGVAWAGPRYRRLAGDRVVVNATPAGADGTEPDAFDARDLAGLDVLDAPYAAPGGETGLVTAAARAGAARVVPGLDLLARQAVAQARLFSPGASDAGDDPDLLADVVRFAVRPRTNLVLVGLRGAGKTAVGRAVARRLGRPFVDLDEDVLRATGRSAGAWIREAGLAAFREAERAAVDRLRGRRGLVVATGGGVLDTPSNGPLLREAGFVVWLEVSPEVAAARCEAQVREGGGGDRPSLLGGAPALAEAEALLCHRAPAWISFAHETVPADGRVEDVSIRVANAWLRHARDAHRGV